MKSNFILNELDCANCANQIESEVKKIDGVMNASVNFISRKMVVEYDETNKEEIIKKLKKIVKKIEPDVKIEEI